MKAPLPAALAEVGVAYAAGKVHVIGGNVLSYTGPFHEEYDPAADKWRARAPLPRSLDHVGVAVLNEKIYVIGGFVGGKVHNDGQDTAFEYDPTSDTWRILAPMKGGRGSVSAVALDGKIHALGGRDATGTTLARHEVYDPATNSWTELAPFSKPRDHMAAAVIDGRITSLVAGSPALRTAPASTTCMTCRPTPGPRRRRCQRRAANSRVPSIEACGSCSGERCLLARIPRTKHTTPGRTAGGRLRRCRVAGMPLVRQRTASASMWRGAP